MFNPGSHSHLIMFFAEATADKYLEAISLLKQSLFNVEFTEERAKTVISQLLNSIPSEKLSASKIVNSLSDNMFFNDRSNIYHASFLRQHKYLTASLEALRVNPGIRSDCFFTVLGKCFPILITKVDIIIYANP